MAELDQAVLTRFQEQILVAATLQSFVEGLRAQLLGNSGETQALTAAAADLASAEAAVDRLFQLITAGVLAADAPDLKRHLADAAAARDGARARQAEAECAADTPLSAPTLAQFGMLAQTLKRGLQQPAIAARKEALRTIVDRIEMTGSELKFVGNARKLAFLAANADKSRVIGFMAGWRPAGDESGHWNIRAFLAR